MKKGEKGEREGEREKGKKGRKRTEMRWEREERRKRWEREGKRKEKVEKTPSVTDIYSFFGKAQPVLCAPGAP